MRIQLRSDVHFLLIELFGFFLIVQKVAFPGFRIRQQGILSLLGFNYFPDEGSGFPRPRLLTHTRRNLLSPRLLLRTSRWLLCARMLCLSSERQGGRG